MNQHPQHRTHTGLTIAALAAGVLGYSLMQTLLVPALPEISHDFGLDTVSGGWILTAYLLAGSIAAPVLGALGDRYGHRRLLVVSLLIFVAGGVLALVAPNTTVLMVARVLQGASTATFPLSLAIVRTVLMPTAQPAALGWLSAMLGAGAGAALVIGGVVTDMLGWRWLFAIGAVMGLLSVLAILRWVPATAALAQGKLDVPGTALLTVMLTSLLLVLTQGALWGWASPTVLALGAVGAASLIAFVAVELRVSAPLVNVALLRTPGFALTSLITLALGAVPYFFYVGLPLLMGATGGIGHGLSVTAIGLAMLPSAILVFVGGRVAPALLARYSRSTVAALSLGLMLIGSAGTALVPASALWVSVFFAVMGLGNGIGFAVAADLVTVFAPRAELAAAVGFNGVLRTVGSAVGTPVTGILLAGTAGASHPATPEPFRALYLVAAAVSLAGVVLSLCIRVPKDS